jgi:hypothetical protein
VFSGSLELISDAHALDADHGDLNACGVGPQIRGALACDGGSQALEPMSSGWAAHRAGLLTVDTVLAGVGAAIAVNATVGLMRNQSTATPFRYVSAYHEELFPPS